MTISFTLKSPIWPINYSNTQPWRRLTCFRFHSLFGVITRIKGMRYSYWPYLDHTLIVKAREFGVMWLTGSTWNTGGWQRSSPWRKSSFHHTKSIKKSLLHRWNTHMFTMSWESARYMCIQRTLNRGIINNDGVL